MAAQNKAATARERSTQFVKTLYRGNQSMVSRSKMPSIRKVMDFLFAHPSPDRASLPPRIPVVALIVSEQDRFIVTRVSEEGPLEVKFVESYAEACSVANRLAAPVILLDRDWPGTDWRVILQSLAASAHPACVILMSGVADGYLLREVLRFGGYDILPKPLRQDAVARVLKLALSYWTVAEGS